MRLSTEVFLSGLLLVLGMQAETQARGFGMAQGGTYVGPGGTTVQHGSVGGISSGPFGGVHAYGAQATRITTPGGRTYTQGSVRSSYGGVAVGYRGGVAVGPYGAAAVGYRGAVGVGPYGGVAVSSGPVAVSHTTTYLSPNSVRAMAHAAQSPYYSTFTSTWYQQHTTAWIAPRWVGTSYWMAPPWRTVAVYCGVTAAPIMYDYGSSVVINNNNVYVNGDQVASAEQYADQAAQFAGRGRQAKPAEDEEWQSLGVFGMVQGEVKTAKHIFQLGVNKAGVVRGNYYDAIADNSLPVYGSVDKQSQRVAWSIGDKKDIVFEAGLNNLTQDQTPILIHYGKERTEQMILVRQEEPKEKMK